jgi:cell division protein FtsA
MSQTSIITGIDVGTDKCVTLIALLDEKSNLRVLGVSAVPSRGMKKSQIIDLEQVFETITESIDAAERMAGVEVKNAYISASGTNIHSQNSKGVVAVASPDQEIIPEDVQRVIEAARAISLPSDREIIHVIPKDFKVDSQEGIKDPIGMTGVRLESEAHIITGMTTALKNMEKCIQDLGVTIDGFVFSGLAAAEVVVSDTEKELGVAVIDIGAGSTSLCVFVDGSLEYSAALPIGARHITQDIALGCRVSLDVAEKIKLSLSLDSYKPLTPLPGETKTDFNKRRKIDDQVILSDLGVTDTEDSISKRTLVDGIMTPRMQEIFSLVAEHLQKHNLLSQIPAGVILTGGGAETVKIIEVAKRELKLPARVGQPIQLQGLTGDIQKPSYATSIGLLQHGKLHGVKTVGSTFDFSNILRSFSIGSLIKKLVKTAKSLLP